MKKLYLFLCFILMTGITTNKTDEGGFYFFPENLVQNDYFDDGILDARNPSISKKKQSVLLVKDVVLSRSYNSISKEQVKRFSMFARETKALNYQNNQFDYFDIDVTSTKMSSLTIYINSIVVGAQQNIGEFFTSTVRIFKGDSLDIEIYSFNSSNSVSVCLTDGCKVDSGTISNYVRTEFLDKIYRSDSREVNIFHDIGKPDKLWNPLDIKYDYGTSIKSSFSLWELQSGFSVVQECNKVEYSFKIMDKNDVEGGDMPIGSFAMYHVLKGDIYINVDSIISKYAGISSDEFETFKIRVISHELGHLIGLKDMGTSEGYSIMSTYENVLYPSKADLAVFRYIMKNCK